MLSNDNTPLTIRTTFDGPTLNFDFPGMLIGVAEYPEGPTGCTVIAFPSGALTAIDVRGGAVGTTGSFEWNHAICLAGGSLYGLEAASGVAAELFAQRNYAKNFQDIALVSGAIVFDYGGRDNAIYPDKALGRAALKAMRAGVFPLGQRGAGISAGCGKPFQFLRGETAGQGGAFRAVGPTKIAAFSVVNALGGIVDRQGRVVRGYRDAANPSKRYTVAEVAERLAHGPASTPSGNTTLTVVVTNQKLSGMALRQLSRQVHASMARAIQPFHTTFDGDVLYAVTTNAVENPNLNEVGLGLLATELVWDAVLSVAQSAD